MGTACLEAAFIARKACCDQSPSGKANLPPVSAPEKIAGDKRVLDKLFGAATSLILSALTVLGVGLCTITSAQAAKFTMVISHLYPDDLTNNETAPALKHFEQLVESATNGEVDVQVFGNGALGGEVEAAQQAIAGKTIQSVMLGSGTQASFFHNYEMITAPFLFPDYRTAWAFFDSPWFADFMGPMAADTGLRYLGTLDDGGGFVAFANNKRLIRTVEDLKDLKIRVEENQAHMTIVRALGAEPISLPWGEVQTGIATGLIDGHFHAPGVNDIFKLYDVADYTTWSGHVYNTITWSVSEAWFQTLPKEYQRIIMSSAREAVEMAHGIAAQISVVGWVNSCEKFNECYLLPTSEKQRMGEIAQPIYRAWLKEEFGESARLYDDIRGQIEAIRTKLNRDIDDHYLN